jgi:hypothetical protein
VLAGLVVISLALVAACTADPPAVTSGPSPTASAVVQIDFEDGELLDPAQSVSWADPLADLPGYTVLTSDEGDGSWSYTSDETQCTIGYWQGEVPASDTASGDEALSDELLATQFGVTADQIAEYVHDESAPFRTPSQLVQTRSAAGADDESATTYLIAARAFAALGTGFVATLECPADTNTSAVWSLLSADPGAFELVFSANGG